MSMSIDVALLDTKNIRCFSKLVRHPLVSLFVTNMMQQAVQNALQPGAVH